MTIKVSRKILQKERIEVCNKCEHNKFDICMKCGCILSLKTKLKSAKCPINKWKR